MISKEYIMKITFAMILLMITAIQGCTTDDSTVLEQVTDDVVVGDILVEEVTEDTFESVDVDSDLEVSLDTADVVLAVEEDVEN
jgi:hypothetical protein